MNHLNIVKFSVKFLMIDQLGKKMKEKTVYLAAEME